MFCKNLILLILILLSQYECLSQRAYNNQQSKHYTTYLEKNRIGNFYQPINGFSESKLIFEAQIASSITLFNNNFLDKKKTSAFIILPEIKIRMLNESSTPIRSPSYLAHLYYLKFIEANLLDPITRTWLFSINHHSNGKSQKTINGNNLDIENGSFSTHYIQIIHYWEYSKNNIAHYLGLGLIQHAPDSIGIYEIPGGMIDRLRENYGASRLVFDYHITKDFTKCLVPVSVMTNVHYEYFISKIEGNYLTEFQDLKSLPKYKFQAELRVKPYKFSHLGLFIRYRSGQDDYNIYFYNNISQVQFGLFTQDS